MEIPSFYFLYTFFPLESCSEYLNYARFHVALESCEWDSIISASGSLNSQWVYSVYRIKGSNILFIPTFSTNEPVNRVEVVY